MFILIIRHNKYFICSASLVDNLFIINPVSSMYQLSEINNTTSLSSKRKEPSKMNKTYLWHLRLGHINLRRIQRPVQNVPLGSVKVGALSVCESCLEVKMTKRPFTNKGYRAKVPLELVHFDFCGPLTI